MTKIYSLEKRRVQIELAKLAKVKLMLDDGYPLDEILKDNSKMPHEKFNVYHKGWLMDNMPSKMESLYELGYLITEIDGSEYFYKDEIEESESYET